MFRLFREICWTVEVFVRGVIGIFGLAGLALLVVLLFPFSLLLLHVGKRDLEEGFRWCFPNA